MGGAERQYYTIHKKRCIDRILKPLNLLAMKKFLLLFALPMLLVGAGLLLSSNSFSPGATSSPAAEKTFVGSDACAGCHSEKHADWIASGHPYKFTIIENGEAPVYPAEAVNFQSQYMTNLGDGTQTWDNIAGVIGTATAAGIFLGMVG